MADRGEWKRHVTEDGKEFFYNERNRTSVWELPEGLDLTCSDGRTGEEESSATTNAAQAECTPLRGSNKASPWEQLVHEGSGKVYYHNTVSGETSWSPPPRDVANDGSDTALNVSQDWIGDEWTGVKEVLQTIESDNHGKMTAEKEKAEALQLASEIEQVKWPKAVHRMFERVSESRSQSNAIET